MAKNENITTDSLSKTNSNEVDTDFSNRLEKIEQGLNANVLLCKGPAIPELINQVKVGSTVNNEELKGTLCRAICGDEIAEIDIKNLQVAVIGREKKIVKVDCANSFSKLHIVKQARRKRPTGIYVNEFLSKSRLSVFNNLRNLKRLHPQKIKSVYTNDGSIFYRLHGAERPVVVRSNQDITNILGDRNTSSSGSTVTGESTNSLAGGSSVPLAEGPNILSSGGQCGLIPEGRSGPAVPVTAVMPE